MGEKRVVPGPLKQLLKADATLTSALCHTVERILPPPSKYRKYLKALEISCHGLPWLAVWIAFFWILWKPSLFEMQINFLLGLLVDMTLVTIVKALVRRRRPPGNKDDMFLAYGIDAYSFPSGHVSRAVYISIFFCHLYPSNSILPFLLYKWAIAVAVSRVLLKRHYLLDVLCGAVLGFLDAGISSAIWLSQPTAVWLVQWLSEENVTLEGLQDAEPID